jgi:hypothetical protein
MTDARFPRVVGFDLPAHRGSNPDPQAPLIALLDTVPTPGWALVFEHEAAVMPDGQRLAQIALDGDRILCSGPALDAQELTGALRDLVERTTRIRMNQRIAEASAGAAVDPFTGGPRS